MRQTGENSNWWALLSVGSLIAWRRIRLDWRLQMAVAFGMLLATALMASGVIYSSVLRQAALRHILKTSRPADVNFAVQVFSPLDRAIYEANERLVEDKIYPTLRPYLRDRALFIQTPTFFFTGREVWDASDDTRPRGPLQYFSSAESQVGLVEGRFPSASTGTLEVVMESNAAAGLGLKVGDSLEMYPGILGEMAPTVKAQIVGLVEAIDPKDEYWFDSSGKLASTNSGWPWAPMFTTQRVVLETLPLVYSNLSITFDWYFYLDKDGVKAERVDDLVAAVETISSQLKGSIKDSTFATNLPAVLARYDHRLLLSRMPLYLTIFLVVGTLLYYLFLVASLLARERTPEIALLKSRGATARQIGFLALTEGGLMAGPAILLGPVLALAMTLLTDRIAPTRLGQTGLLSASLSWQAYLIGAAGALLAVIVFAAAILTAARHTMAEVRQSQARPPATLFLHRYYLDLLILAVVGLLWWQTQSQGSFLVRRLGDEGLQLDFSLLLGPVLGLVSIGLLVLRLFPLLLLLLERVVGPLGPIWLAQALKRSARDPIPGGLMVMLLLLATGLGVVGAAFSASLQQSQTDQVYYETGSDVRVVHTGGAHVFAGHGPAASISSLSGVGGATDVLRTSAWVRTTGFGSEATVLAIDPEGFTDAAWYRLDFNKAALQGLDNSSSPQDTPEGIAIPSSAQGLSLWATVSRPSPLLQLYARLRDSQGYFFDVLFSSLDNPGWSRFSLALPQDPPQGRRGTGAPQQYQAPFILHSLYVSVQRGAWRPGAINLDDLRALIPGSGGVVLEGFQDLTRWSAIHDFSTPGLVSLEMGELRRHPGRQSATLSWGSGGSGLRGLRVGPPEASLSAVVSRSFLEQNNVNLGDLTSLWIYGSNVPIQVVSVVDYFPTLFPDRETFVILNLRELAAFVNLHALPLQDPKSETWVKVSSTTLESVQLKSHLEQLGVWTYRIQDAKGLLASRSADPLVNMGWSGLITLAFLTVVLASISGLLLYSYLDARAQQHEFALLRTLGFSSRQLAGAIWLNLLLVAGVGVTTGTLLGNQLGKSLLPLLEVAEGGRRLTPAMVLKTDWSMLLAVYLFLALAAAITVVSLTWLLGKLELQRVLRIGER